MSLPIIDIRVNSTQLTQARREVELLAGSLYEIGSKNIDINAGSMPDFSAFADFMKGSTAETGGTQDRTAQAATRHRQEVERTQKVVAGMGRDYDKLIKTMNSFKAPTGQMSQSTATSGTTDITAAEAKRLRAEAKRDADALWASVENKPKRKTAADRYFEEHGNYGRTVTSKPDDAGGGAAGGNNSQFMRKALGWGMAAAGVGTLAGFIGSSRSAYRSALDEESPLYAKGLTGSRKRASSAVGLGISPEQYYRLEETLSATGITEKNMGRNAMLTASFAKFGGLDTAAVSGLRSNLYSASGSNETIPNSVIMAMSDATKKGMDKARLPELLTLINRNVGVTAQAAHGAGVESSQVGASARLAISALMLKDSTSYKTFSKSDVFSQGVMQHGLQGAGTAAGEVKLFKLLGGYDGPMNFEKIHKMNVLRNGGFMDSPELLGKIIGGLTPGSKEARAGQLETEMKDWNITGKASEKLVEMFDSGFIKKLSTKKGQTIEQMAKGGDQQAAEWQAEIAKNPALSRQSTEATKDLVKIEAGEQLSKLFQPLELSAANMTKALADGEWKKSFSIFEKAAGEMGPVGKTLLTAGTLFAAGGAMSFAGGALGLGGKAGGGALLGSMMTGPAGLLALLGIGAGAAIGTFKDGAQGGNYLPEYRKNAITGKVPEPTSFNGVLNKDVVSNPRLSPGYKKYAVKIAEAAKRNGVPEPLLAGLIESESSFQNEPARKIKLKGGRSTTVGGLGQFTEETAKQYKINRMDPDQAIDGTARLLSDNYKKSGDWKQAVAQYKGVVTDSPENMAMVDGAFDKSGKYVRTESDRHVLQQATPDPTAQMVLDVLRLIAGHSEATATNTKGKPATIPTRVIPLGH